MNIINFVKNAENPFIPRLKNGGARFIRNSDRECKNCFSASSL